MEKRGNPDKLSTCLPKMKGGERGCGFMKQLKEHSKVVYALHYQSFVEALKSGPLMVREDVS